MTSGSRSWTPVAGSVPAGTPVIPGVFAHNDEQAVAEIAAYADHGGTAVLAAPPGYYPLRAAEQEAYFSRLADATALPLVLYNIPVYTKVQIAPAVAAALASHPRVAGLKDSGRDLGYAATLLDAVAAAGAAADFSSSPGRTRCLSPTCWPVPAVPSARTRTSCPRSCSPVRRGQGGQA